MQENEVLLIDKPAGITSFGVVARVRGVLRRQYGRKVKVGHAGTLDPFATGLMIILTGKECKNASNYSKLDKVYETTVRLGYRSTTGDIEGELVPVSDRVPDRAEIEEVLRKFIGQITQKPPIYSAIKINGQRAYKLARRGESVDMPERQVTVYSLDLTDYDYPDVKITTRVSSGTYIRTLAEDIGGQLGTGAYCVQLRRTAVGSFSIAEAREML